MTKRRPTIGGDAFEAILTPSKPATKPAALSPTPKPARAPRGAQEPQAAPSGAHPVKVTYNLPADLVEEARNAVLALMAPPVRLTLSALVVSALRRELERLRKLHNAGEPFTGPGRALRGGRPLK